MMDAGRELDVMVAEQVLGIDVSDIYGRPIPFPKEYSTDIAAAWQVVERLKARGDGVLIKAYPEGMVWAYSASIPGTDMGALADTAPLAICRLALKATDVEF